MSLFKKEISNCIKKVRTEEWLKNQPWKMIKIFHPNPDRTKVKQLLNLSRKKSRRLVKAITGQNNLYYVQNEIKKTDHLYRLCKKE